MKKTDDTVLVVREIEMHLKERVMTPGGPGQLIGRSRGPETGTERLIVKLDDQPEKHPGLKVNQVFLFNQEDVVPLINKTPDPLLEQGSGGKDGVLRDTPSIIAEEEDEPG